jgi:hypothetical protein
MKSQATYTRAMTLGPFLTLILLSSPRRGRAASEALRSSSSEVPAGGYARLDMRAKGFNPTKPAPLTAGPFLTLILTSGQSQSRADERRQSPPCQGRVPLALPGPDESLLGCSTRS